jgi:glucokinase-like ROK family protein
MKVTNKMNIELMKQYNKQTVLNVLRHHEPISRVEISNMMNLSRPSVSEIVAELLAEGWVRETSSVHVGRGRRPTPLELNPTGRYVFGVELGAYTVTIILCNIRGEISERVSFPLANQSNYQAVLDDIHAWIVRISRQHQIPKEKVLGIGVAMHGPVEPKSGRSIFAPYLGWRGLPIGEYLQSVSGFTTLVESDDNAAALAEHRFGNGQGEQNFITVLVDYGIGSGIIANGALFHGAHNIEGQIGHTTVDEDGPQCSCGNFGCLEVLASEPAIVKHAQKRIRLGQTSSLCEKVDPTTGNLHIGHIYEAAHNGDALAVEVIVNAGRYLGIGLANLINVLDPKFLVLGGGITAAADIILPPIHDAIRARVLGDQAKETPVIISALKDNLYPMGAATLILEQTFASPFN